MNDDLATPTKPSLKETRQSEITNIIDAILVLRIKWGRDMSGESKLSTLLGSMSPQLHEGVYVFATVDADYATDDLRPRMQFIEDEGKTLILLKETAERAGIQNEFPSRMITLNIHSSLEAVGFLAVITTRLARLSMGVNPVSAFYHDHLFVPIDRADDAMSALLAIAEEQ